MFSWYKNLANPLQALIAGIITFLITALGSAIVVFFKKPKEKFLAIMLSLSAGIMLAASFFSLINPALSGAESLNLNPWLVTSIGFLFGGIFLVLSDKLVSHHVSGESKTKRLILLVSSIVLHNIPEGLAIGVAFGSIKYGLDGVTLASALMLSIGIGIQNFPEGSAISLPLRASGYSRLKSFLIGALSGIVEPISSFIGAILVLKVRYALPYFLSFAAGAMIFVVIREIIPESQNNNKQNLMTLASLIGFVIMMILDVALS